MKKPLILLAVAALVLVGGLTYGALALSKSSPKKATTATATKTKLPGIPVNLIACGNAQRGVECVAIYKGQCGVFLFDSATGKLAAARPVDSKYCTK